MKKRKELMRTLFPILLTFSIYLVFYTGIESKPSNPGFWMILAMGMSIGLALKTFFQWIKSKK
ncbi:MAG: hypothetical protein PF485_15445 [Bacteroidales bacterium]|jgi:magnesium-transporting ATPase (P-type)|nr:hypothetical protein [Bacteroidales bacterium]